MFRTSEELREEGGIKISLTFYEKRYGKSEFQRMRDNHRGYYRYHIKIYNSDLIKKLQIEDKTLNNFYNLLPIEEVEELFGMHWIQENKSIKDLHGKIHVCGVQKYEELSLRLYKLFINKLTIEWGYLVGEYYEINEIGYIQLEFSDFYKNFWLTKDSSIADKMFIEEN